MGRVTDIFIAEAGSEPMQSIAEVEAVAGKGLRGDRYFAGTGYYSPFDVCQVTLIASEDIEEINRETGVDLNAGQHRRNIVTEGVDVHDLLGHRFRVGNAILQGTRPRPPCAHVEQLADQAGVASALGDGRGGVCADVIDSGTVRVDDSITVIEAVDRTEGIVERLRSGSG